MFIIAILLFQLKTVFLLGNLLLSYSYWKKIFIIKIHFVYVTPFIASPDLFFSFPQVSLLLFLRRMKWSNVTSFAFPLTSKLECCSVVIFLEGKTKEQNLILYLCASILVLMISYCLAPKNKNYSKDHLFTF